jgi:dolichol-phosphate mannosyltransferase
MRICIITPVANEENYISLHCDELLKFKNNVASFHSIKEIKFVFIMDDFNKDRTDTILREYKKIDDSFEILFNKNSNGLSSCYIYGYEYAVNNDFDYIVEMDCGESHPIINLYEVFNSLLKEQNDIVFHSRFVNNGSYKGSIFRQMVSKFGTYLSNFYLKLTLTDATSGFQAFKKEVIQDLDFNKFKSSGGFFQTELKYFTLLRLKDTLHNDYLEGIHKFHSYYNFSKLFGSDGKKYKFKELPLNYKLTTTNFKYKWLIQSLKYLFLIKHSFVYKTKENK